MKSDLKGNLLGASSIELKSASRMAKQQKSSQTVFLSHQHNKEYSVIERVQNCTGMFQTHCALNISCGSAFSA
jgi:hypothetical protein